MKKFRPVWIILLAVAGLFALLGWYLHRHTIAVLQPAGEIGIKERNLIIACLLLSTIVVVPVFVLLFGIAWRYREGNTRAKYSPDQAGSPAAEAVWWLVPTALMVVISTITWRSSYALDPYKHLDTTKPTMHIQVVAMDWKWLFIYPNHNVASVNEAAIPVNMPVEFDITSDAVMTSFWDPQLGGQMYAMPGMSTALNLKADKIGDFPGSAANISGKGFADMKFMLRAMPQSDFDAWMSHAHAANQALTAGTYTKLLQPNTVKSPIYYKSVTPYLYDTIVTKYMTPINQGNQSAFAPASAAAGKASA